MSADLSTTVKEMARLAGFDLAGLAAPDPPPTLRHLRAWVAKGHAAEMAFLTRQVDRRSDARVAFPWARSILMVGLSYATAHPLSIHASRERGWISRAAWGDDYHRVMETRLKQLATDLQNEIGPFVGRALVDTGPLSERAYAAAAGLGAHGKNTCLIHPQFGSWFFIGALITDLPLAPDSPIGDLCRDCTRCLDACPTGALRAPYVMDAGRCLSYLSIERRGAIEERWRSRWGRAVFGCDICQDVCPLNREARRTAPPGFEPRPGWLAPDLNDLARLNSDDEAFRARFARSAIQRAKRQGLLRNVALALRSSMDGNAEATLKALSQDVDRVVREHAAWSLAHR